jgi:hypothetical protein
VAAGTFTITPVNDAPTFSSLSSGVVRTLKTPLLRSVSRPWRVCPTPAMWMVR